MNSTLRTAFSVATIFALISCGNSESGHEVPIDSTNMNGTGPVQYSEGTPDTPTDTTIQAHDQRMRDTMAGQPNQKTLPQNTPVGNGSNTSNTTDARTTSGSANNGDADKDRKK